jgi:hypothetical protein
MTSKGRAKAAEANNALAEKTAADKRMGDFGIHASPKFDGYLLAAGFPRRDQT